MTKEEEEGRGKKEGLKEEDGGGRGRAPQILRQQIKYLPCV